MRFAFLGTSGAVPSRERDTTSLVFEADGVSVLVDCGGSAVQKLLRLGLDPLELGAVVITHLHADHSYGLPSVVQSLRGLRRVAPLDVVCRPEHVEPLRALLALFGLWPRADTYEVRLSPIALSVGARAAEFGPLAVTTAPNAHGAMPNFAVRVQARDARTVVYSSDTEPSENVVTLARGAHVLVHEATSSARDRGRFGAHSTADEAGAIAAHAGVERLVLTHVAAVYHGALDALVAEAAKRFGGPIEVARELDWYEA